MQTIEKNSKQHGVFKETLVEKQRRQEFVYMLRVKLNEIDVTMRGL